MFRLCAVSLALAACGRVNFDPVGSSDASYTIGGTVSGLVGEGLVLENNGGDALAVSADGAFTFATPVLDGGSYAVTVAMQPRVPRQTCEVIAGTGIVDGGDVSDVVIACTGGAVTRTTLALGQNHTCALLHDGRVKCWGRNSYGQLGLGDTAARGDGPGEMGDALPAVDLGAGRAVALAAGSLHTCALLDDGRVKCWGWNIEGQLGLGDVESRGDDPGEMGDALPAIDLGAGRTAVAITAGRQHTCAVLDDGHVKCWGDNNGAQLGLGDTVDRGDASGEMGDALPVVDLGAGRTATAITAGTYHTCAILDDGHVKCWGNDAYGGVGLGDTSTHGGSPGEMGDALPAVDLGPGRTATAVSASNFHTCALLDGDRVKCWGANDLGRLGIGDTVSRGQLPGEMGDALPVVDLGEGCAPGGAGDATAIAAGFTHTCAWLDDTCVKCWGGNDSGQLGLGDVAARGDAAGEMGDALPAVSL